VGIGSKINYNRKKKSEKGSGRGWGGLSLRRERGGNGTGIPWTRRDPAPKRENFPSPIGDRAGMGSNPLPGAAAKAGAGESSSPSLAPFPVGANYSFLSPLSRPDFNMKLKIYPSFTTVIFIILKGI